MFTFRSSFLPKSSRVSLVPLIALAAMAAAGCASMQDSQTTQYAARECKAVPADFPNRPKKQPTVAEQAEARLALGRLAAERGGYSGIGNSLLSDLNRDCY